MAGAAGALLLQGGFLLLFLVSMPVFRPPAPLERELSLILPHRFAPLPQSGEAQGLPRPVRVTPPLLLPPGPAVLAPAFPPAALPGLRNFGQALNNCTPEKFNHLTPEERAGCPHPGAGMAIQEVPNLMGSPSHVRDNARWANALAHEESPLLLPGANQDAFGVRVGINTDGKLTGVLAQGAFDPQNFPVYDVMQYAPEDFYKIEQAYDAWNKAHPDSAPQIAKPPG